MKRKLANEDGFYQEGHIFLMLFMAFLAALFYWMVSPVLFGGESWNQLGNARKVGTIVIGSVVLIPIALSLFTGIFLGAFWIFRNLFPPRWVTLWNAQTGKQLSRLSHPRGENWIESLSFSCDGELLAGGGTDYHAYVWSLPDGKLVRKLKGIGCSDWKIFFAADSKVLITGGGEQGIDFQDIVAKKSFKKLASDGEKIISLSVSHDRAILAMGLLRGRVQLRWSQSDNVYRELKLGGWVECLTFSADGRKLGAAARNHIKIWDIESGECLCQVSKWQEALKAIALSRDGEIVVGGGYGKRIYFWKAATGMKYLTVEEGAEVSTLAISPDGKSLASANKDGKICIRDMSTGETKIVLRASAIGGPIAWSPNSRIIAGLNGRRFL